MIVRRANTDHAIRSSLFGQIEYGIDILRCPEPRSGLEQHHPFRAEAFMLLKPSGRMDDRGDAGSVVAAKVRGTHEGDLRAIFTVRFRNFRRIRRNDYGPETPGFQGRLDGPGDQRLAGVRKDVLSRNTFRSAARRYDSETIHGHVRLALI